MEAKHIIEAIIVLKQCEAVLSNPSRTPQECGSLSAKAFSAASRLRIYSNIDLVDVPVEEVEA